MKTLILISCFNTHKYTNKLLTGIRNNTNEDILIYDDGSSPKIDYDKSLHMGVIIIRNDINKGKGSALLNGFNYAYKNNYTHIITIDGDLQHNPDEITSFINSEYDIDFVLGNRSFSTPMPIHRIISNSITSFVVSALKGLKIKDSQCGYRRYKLDSVNIGNFNENGYLLETEILLNDINRNSIIKHIPVSTIYNDSKSSINNVGETIKFIKLIVRYIFA